MHRTKDLSQYKVIISDSFIHPESRIRVRTVFGFPSPIPGSSNLSAVTLVTYLLCLQTAHKG